MTLASRYMSDGGTGGSGAGGGTGDSGAAGGGTGGATGGAGGGTAFSFDTFSKGLSEADRAGLTGHFDDQTKGLKSALEGERAARKDLEKQLGDLKAKAEKGSELEKQLEGLQKSLSESGLQTAFYEAAVSAGCTDLGLAWAAARMNVDKFFKRDNTPDMEALKAAHPALFAEQKKANANAGTGTGGSGGGTPNPNQSVNDALRRAAGRA